MRAKSDPLFDVAVFKEAKVEDQTPRLRCRIGGVAVDEMTAKVLWPMAVFNPISYEEYQKGRSVQKFQNSVQHSAKDPKPTESLFTLFAEAFHRYGLASLLVKRGGFTLQEAWCLLYDHPTGDRLEIERRVSAWLLAEFQKLPKGQDASGASPVRRNGLLSPLDIADLAIAMLDYNSNFAKSPPTAQLIDLLGQLLGVTRHRDALANTDQRSRKFSLAAQIDGQAALEGKAITVRELAKLVSVSTGTIVTWRQSSRYRELVDFEKERPFVGEPPPPGKV